MTKALTDIPNKETMSSIYEAIADMSDHHLKVASSYEELEKILDERNMKMKVKYIAEPYGYDEFEKEINDFIKDKKIIDIKFQDNFSLYDYHEDGIKSALIMYEEHENRKEGKEND